MIVCSCNVLSDTAVRACAADSALTPAGVFRALGCRIRCGRCAKTIRAILTNREVGPGALPSCDGRCCAARDTAAWINQGSLAAMAAATAQAPPR
ncbi:hypothetical protein M446_3544 [Methylobacterium sp. 4-46]|uniref:(2Fe-2S)-binding protein n=1 Tax=unclassified Methylobacterium TaxID=2615210 RepID=UPI000152D64D|nr:MULTISPECIES: (2Fe-2S)-binding protein [Methylobacterium]ACA17927.1 hypothetical protein M446_3544 [Methylobacterium sp. 4-46]WFT77228.1 (2Fe-2S)-binding protein [Methylobacterium nodulans]